MPKPITHCSSSLRRLSSPLMKKWFFFWGGGAVTYRKGTHEVFRRWKVSNCSLRLRLWVRVYMNIVRGACVAMAMDNKALSCAAACNFQLPSPSSPTARPAATPARARGSRPVQKRASFLSQQLEYRLKGNKVALSPSFPPSLLRAHQSHHAKT